MLTATNLGSVGHLGKSLTSKMEDVEASRCFKITSGLRFEIFFVE